jgi:hypothetical protein
MLLGSKAGLKRQGVPADLAERMVEMDVLGASILEDELPADNDDARGFRSRRGLPQGGVISLGRYTAVTDLTVSPQGHGIRAGPTDDQRRWLTFMEAAFADDVSIMCQLADYSEHCR